MKRKVFYLAIIPLGILLLTINLLTVIPRVWLGLVEVIELLLDRYENWSFDLKPGTFLNCPWNKTLWQAFKEGAGL